MFRYEYPIKDNGRCTQLEILQVFSRALYVKASPLHLMCVQALIECLLTFSEFFSISKLRET